MREIYVMYGVYLCEMNHLQLKHPITEEFAILNELTMGY